MFRDTQHNTIIDTIKDLFFFFNVLKVETEKLQLVFFSLLLVWIHGYLAVKKKDLCVHSNYVRDVFSLRIVERVC